MKGSWRIALATGMVICFSGDRSVGEYRTWRAAQGSYSAEGEFVSLESGDTVSIRLKDGSVRTIPLAKLSEADQAYVRSRLAPATSAPSQRPAAPQQTEEAADRALTAVDQEAHRCRTAEEAVVLYTVFLSDSTVPSTTRSKASQHLAEWKQMADKGLVRSGSKWVTAEDVRSGRIKSLFLINQGLEMVRLGQYKLGYDKLMEASSAAPDDIYADFIIATVYAIGMNKYDKAEHHYEICLRRDPDNPSVLNNLALTEVKVGHHRDALLHWKAAAALCQDQRIAQNLGRLFDQAGKSRILVSKSILSQLSDVYASLVISKNVSAAKARVGWQYMLIPQEPPPDETAAATATDSSLDPTIAVCGSGFVVSPRYVLTTRGTTKGATDFMIADPMEQGKTLPAKLVASSKDTDLALLECADLKAPALPAELALPRPDTEVLVAGYPLVDASGTSLKMARGNTMAAASVGRVGVLTYEAANSPSVGGGPVTDGMGNVVAMHWKTLGSLNNRYGAGIPMSAAVPFISTAIPADYHPAVPNQADKPWNEIEEQTKMSTVVVLSKTPSQDVGLSKRVGSGFLVDTSCCRCNGFKSIRCLARSCINGKIANIRQEQTGRNPVTGAALVEDVRYYTLCPTCQGRGVIACTVCGGTGVDPELRPPQSSGSQPNVSQSGGSTSSGSARRRLRRRPSTSGQPAVENGPDSHPPLSPALAQRIRDSIAGSRTIDTPRSGPGGTEFRDVPEDGALLVAIIVNWEDHQKTKAIGVTPIYRTTSGQIRGRTFGGNKGVGGVSRAKIGYAIGGLVIPEGSAVEGMKVVMFRDTGNGLNPSDSTYIQVRSGNQNSPSQLRLGLDGSYVIGITGTTSSSDMLTGFGLVLAPR